ncbi:MAG: hypothetical protein ABIQ35_05440 [Verrucomicrobiota bacterium]
MNRKFKDYVLGTNWLTKQERWVIGAVIGLLLVGGAVKLYRTAHPPAVVSESVKN